MTYQQQDHQHFEIRDQRYGSVPMVDIFTWFGDSNKSGISVYTQNLRDLRDAINEYLVDNGKETWYPQRYVVHEDDEGTCDCDEEIR